MTRALHSISAKRFGKGYGLLPPLSAQPHAHIRDGGLIARLVGNKELSADRWQRSWSAPMAFRCS